MSNEVVVLQPVVAEPVFLFVFRYEETPDIFQTEGRLMTNLDARLGRYAPAALSVFRVVVGLLFLCHGTSTLFGWPLGPALPVGDSLEWYAGCIEFATGLLVTLGYLTRPAAFLASGTMAVAFFTQHLPRGFFPIENSGEPAVLFCFSFLLLVFAGGGAYALEGFSGRRRKPARP